MSAFLVWPQSEKISYFLTVYRHGPNWSYKFNILFRFCVWFLKNFQSQLSTSILVLFDVLTNILARTLVYIFSLVIAIKLKCICFWLLNCLFFNVTRITRVFFSFYNETARGFHFEICFSARYVCWSCLSPYQMSYVGESLYKSGDH